MKKVLKLIALCLAVLMLTGCSRIMTAFSNVLKRLASGDFSEEIAFSDMVYTRPDMDAYNRLLEESCRIASEETDLDTVVDQIWVFYDAYDRFYTDLTLADIHYSGDLTDAYWEAEYNYCMDHSAEADASLDTFYRALAKSPLRSTLEGDDYFGYGFFDSYDGESIWDETFSDLMNREAELESRYYALSSQALDVEYYSEEYFSGLGAEMAELFVEMVALRQETADYLGYDSYPEFAYDYYFYRDYTPYDAEELLTAIQAELTDLYMDVDVWDEYRDFSERQTLSYVRSAADAMGGSIKDAFDFMERNGLYDISYSPNKYDSSFEVFLDSYMEPFVFMNPGGTDYDGLTLAHEFGHFCSDYVSSGSHAGTDVAEVFSQGMEYLSLCYGSAPDSMIRLKMADCLSTYVEQAAYAAFEHQVYNLRGDDLTVENVRSLYEQIGYDYGFGSFAWDSRDFVTVTHFFTNPMYVISYVVSNDAAFQIYQAELEHSGRGLRILEDNLDTEQAYFLAFLEEAGLEDPFAPGRVREVAKTLSDKLA